MWRHECYLRRVIYFVLLFVKIHASNSKMSEHTWMLQFIEIYKEQTCLWDKSSEDYDNEIMKNLAFSLLLEKVWEIDKAATTETVIEKINELVRDYKADVERDKDNDEKLWAYRPYLNFLSPQNLEEITEKKNQETSDKNILATWKDINLQMAIDEILSKELTVASAAARYNIPTVTLYTKLKALSRAEEMATLPETSNDSDPPPAKKQLTKKGNTIRRQMKFKVYDDKTCQNIELSSLGPNTKQKTIDDKINTILKTALNDSKKSPQKGGKVCKKRRNTVMEKNDVDGNSALSTQLSSSEQLDHAYLETELVGSDEEWLPEEPQRPDVTLNSKRPQRKNQAKKKDKTDFGYFEFKHNEDTSSPEDDKEKIKEAGLEMNNTSSNNKSRDVRDDCVTFADHMIDKMRTFDHEQKCIAQKLMSDVMFFASMKRLKINSAVVLDPDKAATSS